jgi:hypothetical protein
MAKTTAFDWSSGEMKALAESSIEAQPQEGISELPSLERRVYADLYFFKKLPF